MTTAVLVMAYGTPSSPTTVLEFYTDVRRGRPPSEEQLAELTARYAAIGGVSPMLDRTKAQVLALGSSLEELRPGAFRTYYGAKHSEPKIEAAVAQAAAEGASGLTGLVLAPHFSSMGPGEYIERARDAADLAGLPSAFIERWWQEPALLDALVQRIHAAMASLPESRRDEAVVLFSAHSLPERVLEIADPYPDELAASAELVADAAGLERFRTVWQSAGRTPDPWLGPDIGEVIDGLAEGGVPAVVVCPIGFTSDHLEVLYDLDIVAAERAAGLGMEFRRTASINADPAVFAALARRIVDLAPPDGVR